MTRLKNKNKCYKVFNQPNGQNKDTIKLNTLLKSKSKDVVIRLYVIDYPLYNEHTETYK